MVTTARFRRAASTLARALVAALRSPLAPLGLLAPLALAALAAVAALASREPSSEVVAEPTPSVPSDVVFYAHVLYGGDDAYLVDGRWFRPGAEGWLVFTKEPVELALIRRTVEDEHDRASRWF